MELGLPQRLCKRHRPMAAGTLVGPAVGPPPPPVSGGGGCGGSGSKRLSHPLPRAFPGRGGHTAPARGSCTRPFRMTGGLDPRCVAASVSRHAACHCGCLRPTAGLSSEGPGAPAAGAGARSAGSARSPAGRLSPGHADAHGHGEAHGVGAGPPHRRAAGKARALGEPPGGTGRSAIRNLSPTLRQWLGTVCVASSTEHQPGSEQKV